MTLKNYIQNNKVDHFTSKGIEVFIKDRLPENIDFREILQIARKRIPSHLLSNIDVIYIGQFKHMIDREIQALYKDSSIFMSNHHVELEDMLDDFFHEIAHSTEEIYKDLIYGDGTLEHEFLVKRKQMWMKLKSQGFEKRIDQFLNPEYQKEFDSYLYREVGYPTLTTMLSKIFYSPYAATSIKEYYANGFEAYFMKEDVARLKTISPVLFNKLGELVNVKYN